MSLQAINRILDKKSIWNNNSVIFINLQIKSQNYVKTKIITLFF